MAGRAGRRGLRRQRAGARGVDWRQHVLPKDAVAAMLHQVAGFAPSTTLVMSFMLPLEQVDAEQRRYAARTCSCPSADLSAGGRPDRARIPCHSMG
jgi:hypothetical protein